MKSIADVVLEFGGRVPVRNESVYLRNVLLLVFPVFGQILLFLWQRSNSKNYHRITSTLLWIIPFAVYGLLTSNEVSVHPDIFRFDTNKETFLFIFFIYNIGAVVALAMEHRQKRFGNIKRTELWSFRFGQLTRKVCKWLLVVGTICFWIEIFLYAANRKKLLYYPSLVFIIIFYSLFYGALNYYYMELLVDKRRWKGQPSEYAMEESKNENSEINATHPYETLNSNDLESSEEAQLVVEEEMGKSSWRQKLFKLNENWERCLYTLFCYIYIWQPIFIFLWFLLIISIQHTVSYDDYFKQYNYGSRVIISTRKMEFD